MRSVRKKMSALFQFLPVPVLILLTSCQTASNPDLAGIENTQGGIGGTGLHAGIGGTGHRPSGSGIGGTGLYAGIGGTGRRPSGMSIGGTGLIGTITAFGSIWVNNAEITYDAQTPVTANGAPLNDNALRLGHVVAVEIEGDGDHFKASKINILFSVCGTVDKIDKNGAINVMGQEICSTSATAMDAKLQIGARVRISGLRRADGSIVASRIESAEGEADYISPPIEISNLFGKQIRNFSVQGYASEQSDSVTVGSLRIGIDKNTRYADKKVRIKNNDRICVWASLDDSGQLKARSILLERGDLRLSARSSGGIKGRKVDAGSRGTQRQQQTRMERTERAQRPERVTASQRAEYGKRADRAEASERAGSTTSRESSDSRASTHQNGKN